MVAPLALLLAAFSSAPAPSQLAGVITHLEGIVHLDASTVETVQGRAEAIWPDGSVLHVDEHSRVRVDALDRASLEDGRLFVRTTAVAIVQVDSPVARVRLAPGGAYSLLFDRTRRQLLISVSVGRASIDTSFGTTVVSGREMAMLAGGTSQPFVTAFDPARWDPFELWSDDRVAHLSFGPSSRWTRDELTRLGLVIDRPKASSLTCSSWLTPDNPCWVVGTAKTAAPPGRPRP